MSRIKYFLLQYVKDTENAIKNIELANEYFRIGHYAAALSFFLRGAERTFNKELQYYSLLKMARCLEIADNRTHTVKSCYQHCITILPNRPEAYYYLSRIYEKAHDWTAAYVAANQGILFGINDHKIQYSDLLDYPGKQGLYFQKAIAAWWWGKNKETKDILQYLSISYKDSLNNDFKEVIQHNITRIGSSIPAKKYKKYQHNNLKFKFSNSELIESNYSQVYQDLFVLAVLDGKQKGTYLEIGSGDPFITNNTALLEKNYAWKGCGVEVQANLVEKYKNERANSIICEDARNVDYLKVLKNIDILKNNIIDYLQVDCEPAKVTYEVLLKIPFDKYKFRVITFEHDFYSDIDKVYRDNSRLYLSKLGYTLLVNDICSDNEKRYSFEDWWIHKDLVNNDTINNMYKNDLRVYTDPEEYFGFK